MKYLSLFSGIGGFELGIQQAYERIQNDTETRGCGQTENISKRPLSDIGSEPNERQHPTCIGFSEIDKYAAQIYQKHFTNHKNYGDIKLIDPKELPDFELLVGGFPCQAFSVAGKRKGFDDTRGTLFFEIARIIREKQPRLLLLENVKGLLSHDEGRTFSTIISTLDELGYDLQWQVLNSKNFGVPQNRERVFIVGHLRGTSRPEVFPIGESNQQHIQESKQPESSAFWDDRNKKIREISPTLDQPEHNSIRVLQPDFEDSQEGGDKSNNTNRIRRTSYTDGARIRRLTPTECERLQGFPDGWTEGVSDTQRYKTLGNAVTVNVIQAIMEKLLSIPVGNEEK